MSCYLASILPIRSSPTNDIIFKLVVCLLGLAQYIAVNIHGHHYFVSPPTHIDSVPTPGVTVTDVTSSQVVYETTAHGSATRVIAGFEVTRFGVPMIGEYVNTGRGMNVTVSPAVPGAQYRITAWALGNGSRSATPAMESVTTGEASEFCIRSSAS